MQLHFQTLYLKKRFPLRISRGVFSGADSLFVAVTKNGITGWGEMAPGSTQLDDNPEKGQAALIEFASTGIADLSVREIYDRGRVFGFPGCVQAALDVALWDQLAKSANLPLYKMLGIAKPKVPTSITIGIMTPEEVQERIPLLLAGNKFKALKVKLGSPDGIEADKAMFAQVIESSRAYGVKIRVDANGGWSVDDAIHMMQWLADRGCEYVEQPLVAGREADLPHIYKKRPLPIFVDESCCFATDIPAYAHVVDGVNLKLMKCGGITEALKIIATARAFKLKTMIGCMGESSMAISAGAAISGLLDYIDLDAHLNLDPDPCTGAELIDGVVVPNDQPGHGATITNPGIKVEPA